MKSPKSSVKHSESILTSNPRRKSPAVNVVSSSSDSEKSKDDIDVNFFGTKETKFQNMKKRMELERIDILRKMPLNVIRK